MAKHLKAIKDKMTIKILHVIIGLNIGGAERFLCRLIESHQGSEYFSHRVISLTSKGKLGEKLETMGVTVIPLGMKNILQAPIAYFKTLKEIRSSRPDLVQCWMYHADLIGGLSAKTAGVNRVLWGIRNTHFEAGGTVLKRSIRKLCAYLSWSIPEKIVCVAETALTVHKSVGYDHSKMLVIPNGYNTENFTYSPNGRIRIRKELKLDDDHIVIGSVGRYCAAKDHENLIKAAAESARKDPRLRFLLIGRDLNNQNQVILEKISAAGCPENFILLNERSDIPDCMSAMDIFCLHSKTEGFPNVLGEAMSIGLPCITTDAGDAKFLLGDCGSIVPTNDSKMLATAITAMSAMSKQERHSLGYKSRKRIEENFTLNKSVEKFEEIYLQNIQPKDHEYKIRNTQIHPDHNTKYINQHLQSRPLQNSSQRTL